MKFEMPKMNVAIFSCENIVTASGDQPSTTTVTNLSRAQDALAAQNITNVTTISASQWLDA